MLRSLPANTSVIDALTVPNPAAVIAAGYSAYCPYLRNFTIAQRDAFWAQGIGLLLIQEDTGSRARGGAANADRDYATATRQAIALGWDGSAPIAYSETDFDVQPSDFAACDAYYGRIIELHRNAGQAMPVIYGARAYINHAATWVPFGVILWEAGGWKWASITSADVTQHTKQVNLPTICDTDSVLTNLTVWTGLGNDPMKGDDMNYRHTPDGTVYELVGGYKAHVSGPYFYGALNGALYPNQPTVPGGVVSYPTDQATMDQIADYPFASGGVGAHVHDLVLGTYTTGEPHV